MSTPVESVDVSTLQTIIANLVTTPEDVKIERKVDEMGVLLSVRVNAQDMGILIGRGGAMATSIKVIMKAVGKANNMNVRVQFLEPDGSLRYAGGTKSDENHDHHDHQPPRSEPDPENVKALENDLDEFMIN
jgi:predicted RNA-binding protein YlqC (UPF0109 family)